MKFRENFKDIEIVVQGQNFLKIFVPQNHQIYFLTTLEVILKTIENIFWKSS